MNAASKKKPAEKKLGFFGRIALYIRQIFGELKKVQRPSRSELWQMFLTVILFVTVVMIFVGLLDAGFGRLTLWIFG
ncbi:MAG: preprotein translocase subunit SecE [Ancrocorticia sp.]|uniref:preprotein translocase subunit SecE n=1 Tax=Ancrocorticia sp. TaxID=2593684 RepID=UPI003F91CE8B